MWLVLIPPPLSKVGVPKMRVGCRKVSVLMAGALRYSAGHRAYPVPQALQVQWGGTGCACSSQGGHHALPEAIKSR